MRSLLIALALAAPSVTFAQAFEATAETAQRVSRIEDVVWTFTAPCTAGDDVQQRQCRLVRDGRQQALAGALLLVDGDSAALEIAKWNPQKKSLAITVSSCIRCGGVDVEGKKWFVTGNGSAPRFEKDRLRTHVLRDTALPFPDEAAATAWAKPLANARVQYLVKVPARPRWTAGGNTGFGLEVVGFRVINACDGAIVVANPASAPVAGDKAACSADAPPPKPVDTRIDALTSEHILAVMRPVVEAANGCFARYKVSGTATLAMTVDGDGRVTDYAQKGDFAGTPTAACIDVLAKKVRFPPSKKPSTPITFPIVLK